MRTTLKRGYGRAAEAGALGNGAGNGHAVLPPNPPSPMTRYRQPEPPHRSGWRTAGAILGWFVVCLLVLASGLSGGLYLWAHESLAATAPHSKDVIATAKRLNIAVAGKPATALVIGYDHRAGDAKGTPSRSDTIMLLRADPETNTLSMLSFPRDLVVDIYCPGHATYQDRINAAYSECGSKGTLETVRHLTGIDVNYLITVNFIAFRQVVDALGGVWMDIDRRYYNKNVGTIATDFTNIDLQPGYQKLNGADALSFVRYRHTDNDIYRVVRQQAFVRAAKLQMSRFSIFSLPRLVSAVTAKTEIAQAGAKGIDFSTLKSYALFLHGLPQGHFFQPRIEDLQDTGFQNAELAAPQSAIDQAMQDFLHPDVGASSAATSSALGRKVKPKKTIPASQISIAPLNGNGVEGSANAAATQLQQRGYKIVVPATGNAPNFDYFNTKIYFDPANGGVKRAAQQVAILFGSADVARIPANIRPIANNSPYVAVLGSTFHGTLAPAPVDHTPKRQPPVVTVNPGATLPFLRPLKKRVPFRIEYPAVLERSSVIDSATGEVPVRVYELKKGYRAIRLTYRTGANEYWGVEETAWGDAPILQGANTAFTKKGRHYQLYYSGSKLHMVVLKENGATYWVVNTLLDSLSNETMLAIAEGLHPLPR